MHVSTRMRGKILKKTLGKIELEVSDLKKTHTNICSK